MSGCFTFHAEPNHITQGMQERAPFKLSPALMGTSCSIYILEATWTKPALQPQSLTAARYGWWARTDQCSRTTRPRELQELAIILFDHSRVAVMPFVHQISRTLPLDWERHSFSFSAKCLVSPNNLSPWKKYLSKMVSVTWEWVQKCVWPLSPVPMETFSVTAAEWLHGISSSIYFFSLFN